VQLLGNHHEFGVITGAAGVMGQLQCFGTIHRYR
jgi:hypothetical protein